MIKRAHSVPLGRFAALVLTTALLFSLPVHGTTSPQVYNVVSYGADPTGVNDSSGAVNRAIFAAMSGNQPVGTIYFPPGTFTIAGPVPAAPLTGSAVNMFQLVFMGTGVNATLVSIASGGSITLTSPGNAPYHGGMLRDFSLSCASNTVTGITTVDTRGLKFLNLAISNCQTGVDMQNQSWWTERNDFDDVSFNDCATAIHFDRLNGPSNPAPAKTESYAYNSFRIWVNTGAAASRIFWFSGGAQASGSNYSIQGNIFPGTTIFDTHSDSPYNSGNSIYNATLSIKVEDNVGSGTSYLFDTHNAGGGSGEIHGIGQFQFGPLTQWSYPGSVAVAVNNILTASSDLGALTTTSASSDAFSNLMITPNSKCIVQPNNLAAASMTKVYVSSIDWGQAVLSHPTSHAGAIFEIWCHP